MNGVVSTAGALAAAGCSTAGAVISVLGGGAATEITQLCVAAKVAQTYLRVVDQYNLMRAQATYIKSAGARYWMPTSAWRGMTASATYPGNVGWIGSINRGIDAAGGWARATMKPPVWTNFGKLPGGVVARKQSDFSMLELQDGAGVSALDTIGRIRAGGPQSETALAALEADTFSDTDEQQSAAAQMRRGNALALVQAKQQADANKLLVTQTEMALLRLRQEREARVAAIESDIAWTTQGSAASEAFANGFEDAARAYRVGR
ncbi:MAG: hypothetical protein NVS1B14_01620 [Vulcanimicrobiaceae bacterium]